MRAARLLVLSSRAGGLNAEIESRIRQAFADHTVLRFGAVKRIQTLVTPTAKVVVAGGERTHWDGGRPAPGSAPPGRRGPPPPLQQPPLLAPWPPRPAKKRH